MNRLSTLPSAREQACHALLLLGAPAPAHLVVQVHGALFDGDLDVPALATLVRDDQRDAARTDGGAKRTSQLFCRGLAADLTPAGGLVALAAWPLATRIVTPAAARADRFAAVARVAQFVAARSGAGSSPDRLLRILAADVPGGPEAVDLADAARAALADPALVAAVQAEAPERAAAVVRAAQLDEAQQLFGVATLPRQRDGG
jgi:hypothetical protein